MKSEDFKKFMEFFEDVAKLTNSPHKGESALALMFAILGKYSFEQVAKATLKLMEKDAHRFPAVSDIAQAISGRPEDNISQKFQQFIGAIRQHGYYKSVRFADPKIHFAVNRLGGWMHLCQTTEDDKLVWLEKDFKRLYEEAERAVPEILEREAVHLQGFFEVDNKSRGYYESVPKPELVGFERPMLTDGGNRQ